MKKHLALAGILAATFAGTLHADLIKVAINGGYSTIDMKDVNTALDNMKKGDDASGLTNKKNTKYGNAFFVAAEAGIGILPFIEIGPRIEYLQAMPVEYRAEGTGTFQAFSADSSLTSFLLGINANVELPLTGLGFQAAAYAGHGYAVAKNTYSNSTSGASGSQYTGGGFVSELEAKLTYSIIPMVSLDLVGGMRFAAVGVLADGGKSSVLSYDYSGINAGGGLTVGF